MGLRDLLSRPPSTDLSVDQLTHLVSNERRRLVLDILAEADGVIYLGDFADDVARRENELGGDDKLTGDERKRVYISLYQTHLPKLAGGDIIDYDKRSGAVWPGPEIEAAVYLMRHARAVAGQS